MPCNSRLRHRDLERPLQLLLKELLAGGLGSHVVCRNVDSRVCSTTYVTRRRGKIFGAYCFVVNDCVVSDIIIIFWENRILNFLASISEKIDSCETPYAMAWPDVYDCSVSIFLVESRESYYSTPWFRAYCFSGFSLLTTSFLPTAV